MNDNTRQYIKMTETPVRKDLAMTGEITLRGKVLPVGGIKEKVIAAHRAGVKKVLLPRDNMKDIDELPQNVKHDLEFRAIDTIDDVLEEALVKEKKPKEKKKEEKKKEA